MTEAALRDYFEGRLSAADLAQDVRGSQVRSSHDVISVRVVQISEGEFNVSKMHLLKLCDDVIVNRLSTADLNTIAFALMTSEYFSLNDGTPDGDVIADTVFQWDNPEIGYELTIENVMRWKARLESGVDLFDPSELKRRK